MTEKLQIIIKEEVAKLPKETQDAINSLDWIKITEEMGKKYLLSESEINDFQTETLLILIGLTDPQFYPTNIENNVGTTKNDSESMAEETYQKIFIPISKVMEENIKNSLKTKKPDTEQTVNFILSGGDYSSFLESK